MLRRSRVATVAMLCSGMLLAGCTSTPPRDAEEPAAEVIDAHTCVAFGDVLTILFNADIAYRDGRIDQQEHEGWDALATRVLDRVPTRAEGAVSDAVAALKHAAPAIHAGASAPTGIDSVAWNEAYVQLSEACTQAGAELAVVAFTGG
ncbi:MAG: hypothetical protein KF680_05440 [Cryobacterium sp.]|nr:hypothetical protein [Cryobacterium sp.]